MSEEQIKAFLEKVQGDTSFQEKPRPTSDVNAVVAITKETELNISADDLTKAQFALSGDGLEGVARGSYCYI